MLLFIAKDDAGDRVTNWTYTPKFRKAEYKKETGNKYTELLKKYILNKDKKVEQLQE